jgi:hypothetical protein
MGLLKTNLQLFLVGGVKRHRLSIAAAAAAGEKILLDL